MLIEHLFTYSRVTKNIRYRTHSAHSKDALDLQSDEILDEMLDYDGTEIWARYDGRNQFDSVYKDFCAHIKHCYPKETIIALMSL